MFIHRRKKLSWCFKQHIKTNPKWIKGIHVRTKTIKFLVKHRFKSSWRWIMQWFLIYKTKAQTAKGKIDKLNFIKNLTSSASKDLINKVQKYSQNGRKYLQIKVLVAKVY